MSYIASYNYKNYIIYSNTIAFVNDIWLIKGKGKVTLVNINI